MGYRSFSAGAERRAGVEGWPGAVTGAASSADSGGARAWARDLGWRVSPEQRKGEEGREQGVEGPGAREGGPAQNLPPAPLRPSPLPRRGLLSTGWPCAPQRSEFLPGPRQESAETGARPGGSTGGPRR